MLASLLARHGVSTAIISPGSRNAPLVVALERHADIDTRVVIDERSAAFIALGISVAHGGEPVALVCTSGTAPLNYAPAVAEAYYRNIPLIVVTADRPSEWIDQDDSQTIVQPGIYSNFIKGTFDIPVESDDPDRMWYINRTINDALTLAMADKPGPVHINVRLADPLGAIEGVEDMDTWSDGARFISRVHSQAPLDAEIEFDELGQLMGPSSRVLILAGFMEPCCADAILRELSRRPNIVVMHEAQSNLHGYGDFIANIDATLHEAVPGIDDVYTPDIVITIGGSLTSRMIKTWLRKLPSLSHWSIGPSAHAVDCLRKLTHRIPYNTTEALTALCKATPKRNNSEITSFKQAWLNAWDNAKKRADEWADKAPWCDFKAMHAIIRAVPKGWNLQVSNGTAVRYTQLFDYAKVAHVGCNRGVSGIDGCTSTAIGMAVGSQNATLLITGDMSAQYDLGALACNFIPDTFKMIVLNNGGGGIFRYIPSTRKLDELNEYFVTQVNLPLAKLAPAFGFKYLCASNEDQLKTSLKKLMSSSNSPTILEVKTDGEISAQYLTEFFES